MSYLGLNTQKSALNDIFNNRFRSYKVSAKLANDLTDVHMSTYRILSWETARYDRAKISALGKKQLETLKRAVETVQSGVDSKSATAEEKKIYESMMKDMIDYQKAIISSIDLADSDLNFATMFMAKADGDFEQVDKVMHELMELEEKVSAETYAGAMETFSRVIAIMAAVLLGAVALSFAVSLIIARSVTQVLGAEPHGSKLRKRNGPMPSHTALRERETTRSDLNSPIMLSNRILPSSPPGGHGPLIRGVH